MKKLAASVVFCLLAAGTAAAQTSTSPQGGAAIYAGSAVCIGSSFNLSSNIAPLPPPCTVSATTPNDGQWFTVEEASLKTSTGSDLFISPSLITGLYTNTQVKGNANGADTETATAVGSVSVRVLLDCTGCAAPGQPQTTTPMWVRAAYPDPTGAGIVFDARIQQLTAELGQAVTSACISNISTCPAEVINLVLSTTSAHTFNFILPNVPSANTHTITVQAELNTGAICYKTNGSDQTCSTKQVTNTALASEISAALFGVSSLTVVPVHLGPGFTF